MKTQIQIQNTKTQIQDRHMGRAGRTVAAQRRQYLSRQRTGSIGSKGSELRKETNKAKTRSEVKTDTEQSETNFWGDLFRAWGEVLALRWEQAEWVGRMVKVGEMEQEVNLGWEGGEGGGNVRKGEVRLWAWYLKGARLLQPMMRVLLMLPVLSTVSASWM